jgi:hypothetical protein
VFAEGLDEIAAAMRRTATAGQYPPEIDNSAALVFAAFVRHLGTPIGILAHDRAAARDRSFAMTRGIF